MLEIGEVRIAPASSYKDGGLDNARRDNELKKSYYSDGAKVSVTLSNGAPAKPIGAVEHAKATTDYYTLCASLEHDPRLKRDFPNKEKKSADACPSCSKSPPRVDRVEHRRRFWTGRFNSPD